MNPKNAGAWQERESSCKNKWYMVFNIISIHDHNVDDRTVYSRTVYTYYTTPQDKKTNE